jgi:3-dehydroquinate dehydratase-2
VKTVWILNGPKLDQLGTRQVDIYGTTTLAQINKACEDLGEDLDLAVYCFQTNDEQAYVDHLRQSANEADFLILNPGRWTHTSTAVRDALTDAALPSVEVHLSNVYARESFRHVSHIAGIVLGRIMGLGPQGYLAALLFAAKHLENLHTER